MGVEVMPSQAETIREIVDGENAADIRRPSGMAVINPDNLGVDAALITYMRSYWRRLGRDDPRAILLRLTSGEIVRPTSSSGVNFMHKRKVKKVLRPSYSDPPDATNDWDHVINRAPFIDTNDDYVSGPTEHGNMLLDHQTEEPWNFEQQYARENEDDAQSALEGQEWTTA